MKDDTKGMLLGLFGVTAFGLSLPATRLAAPFLDPYFLGLGRAVVAALAAVACLFWLRTRLPNLKQVQQLVIVALGVVVGFPVLSSWAMQHAPASHGGVILGLLPLTTAVVGSMIGRERPSFAFWLVSIAASSLVAAFALVQGGGRLQVADIALLGSVLCAAIGYAVGAKLSKEMGGPQVICWALVLSLPFIFIPAMQRAPESLAVIPLAAYFGFVYLALVSQLFAFFLWYRGLALGGVARVSQIQLLQPFVTLFASSILMGEAVAATTYIFVVLIVAFVWLGKRMPIGAEPNR